MKQFMPWIRRLRLRRRDRRVALLGGFPELIPDARLTRFEPDLHEADRLKDVLDRISTLGAESFDEATGDPLDDSINLQADECESDLNQQYEAFQGEAEQRLAEARAVAQQYRLLHDVDLVRLQATELAVEAAIVALSGHEPVEVSDSRATRPGSTARAAQPIVISAVPEVAETGSPPAGQDAAAPDADEPDRLDGRAARSPAGMSRREFGKLLAPQDASRVPRWGEPGFRDGSLLAGRPYGSYLHVLALILAAAADIGAFVQVVELVLPQQSDLVIWTVIVGLTAVVLYIAHTVGVLLRESRARERGARGLARIGGRLGQPAAVILCSAIWLGVGLMAFWVRKTVPLPTSPTLGGGGIGTGGGSSGGLGLGGLGLGTSSTATSATTAGHTLQGAAIFLSLYLATGVVAAAGAYFTHNPYRGRYARSIRAYRKASERAAASIYQLGQAVARYHHQQRDIAGAPRVLKDAQRQNVAYAERLKQRVRVEIAGLARDPAVTDAIFGPDHRPYWPGEQEPPSGEGEPGAPNP